MSRVVWKETLLSGRGVVQTVEIPTPFEIVHVAPIDAIPDRIDVWFLCDPATTKETVTFVVAPTGVPVEDDAVYVGTVLFRARRADPIVFHVFRRRTPLEHTWEEKP